VSFIWKWWILERIRVAFLDHADHVPIRQLQSSIVLINSASHVTLHRHYNTESW
jgi:hypothetical protein